MISTEWLVRENRLLGYVALGIVVLGSSLGNILLKIGAGTATQQTPIFGLLTWQTIAGILCFGCGLIAYVWALKLFDLHVVQIIVSVQYVVVIVLAALVLGEQITMTQWCGIALIAVGLFVCSF